MSAGRMFLAVVEQNPEDRRALGNWGNALCLRAELAQDPEVRGPHAAMLTPWQSDSCRHPFHCVRSLMGTLLMGSGRNTGLR